MEKGGERRRWRAEESYLYLKKKKKEPLEPRKGRPGERLTARAGHECTTLPYSFRL